MGRLLRESARALAIAGALILLLELVLRVAAFGWYHSEYYLFYGAHNWVGRVGINPWSTIDGAYYKLPPNYVLTGANGQGSETASINSQGFRGPDFEVAKRPGVFRVVCLGESSTFGYKDRDEETYPFLLGRLFAHEQLPVEVINAGFPYYNTGSILSLLKQDLLRYRPDLLTLYAGFNDTGWPLRIGPLGRLALWFHGRSMTYLLLREQMSRVAYQNEVLVFGKLIPQRLPPDELIRESHQVAARFRDNVRAIVHFAKSRDIPVILIKQPITAHERNYTSLTYEQEYRAVQGKFDQGRRLSLIEMFVLKHHRLMEELEKLAAEEGVPLVDNVRIVDQDRRRLVSWVHLTGEANARLAEALAPLIKPYVLRAHSHNGKP